MRIRTSIAFGLIMSMVGVASLAVGCSDDEGTPSTTTDGGADTGSETDGEVAAPSLKGTVTYNGTQTGGTALYVVAFSQFPPSGPPDYAVKIENPTLPAEYEIKDIAPGTYTAAAFLAIGHDNDFPVGSDPESAPVEVTVGASGATTQNLELLDPQEEMDGGTDGGDASDDAS